MHCQMYLSPELEDDVIFVKLNVDVFKNASIAQRYAVNPDQNMAGVVCVSELARIFRFFSQTDGNTSETSCPEAMHVRVNK